MARKRFQGIDAILGTSEPEPVDSGEELLDQKSTLAEEEKTEPNSVVSSKGPTLSKSGSKGNPDRVRRASGVRATTVFCPDTLDRVRAMAYWERRPIKDVIDEALTQFFESKGNEYVEIAVDAWRANRAR